MSISKAKVNLAKKKHDKWIEFLEQLMSSNTKKVKVNVVVDALLRRCSLISIFPTKLLGFEHIRDLYALAEDFASIFLDFELISLDSFFGHDGCLFKGSHLCILKCYL
jgi:hypothetical protein